MKTIRIRISPTNGQPVWYVTAAPHVETPAEIVANLNRAAKREGVPQTYALATEEEWAEYRAALIADGLRVKGVVRDWRKISDTIMVIAIVVMILLVLWSW